MSHRQVLHVLEAADDLHVFHTGRNGVGRLVNRLQAAAAKAIHRAAASSDRQSGHERDGPRRVVTLLAGLLRTPQDDIADLLWIDRISCDERP